MSITVAELLAEPQLGLRMLAGEAGLQHRITWAHTSDLPRLWEWVTGGELMMTNGLSIPADPQGQVELAEALVAAGASALAIGEKMHAPELTAEFIEACERLPLPVLNVPYPLPFIAIARSVAESSLLEESRRLRQTARIYDLLRLAAAPNQWQALVRGLAAELDAQLFVVDRNCHHPWHPDGAPLPGNLAAALQPFISSSPTAGKKFQWHHTAAGHVLMMDIPTHEDALLVVVPASEPHPDAVVLLHAASVLGLELSRSMLALEDERRLGSEFLADALEGRYGLADLERQLAKFGLEPGHLVVASLRGADSGQSAGVPVELWRHGLPVISLQQADTLHLVLPADAPDAALLHAIPQDARVGLSRPADTTGLQRARQESLWAAGAAARNGERLARYAEGPSWLGLTAVEEGQALVQRLLGPLLEHDRDKHSELVRTLRTYLEQQRSWQKTADALFTHRQTVIYRIRRIGELTGLDMTETSTLAQLWFALQIHEALPG
ncbi:transcriptional regulator [Arthrobacter crystallopoietes BAB-32]|uniref:Transcriptional regulator n=1 Tax=Arthrobacter crystallopoietes BAB-32 TaxID=1246476 RepID=N1UTS0_9MICC|nr:PucR family transcriptional regulator [Arthrobacter crystallopoietes]EMY32465.1 transcriptional regulator [Arthrobacter crystallopoietes BAB-32]